MGHLFSRAIKRFTQCSGSGRNQLPAGCAADSSQQQAAAADASQRDPGRPTIQSIPVGQSIDSAEYAALKTASSSDQNKDNTQVTCHERSVANVNDDKENEVAKRQAAAKKNDLAANDQNKPEVEEAVIKIQALVRGHLTRKALKDAQQQAATVSPNALGQSQFDEESLRNPPNAVFLNASPANPTNLSSLNNNNQQQQQTNKLSNNRVPPLESIAEDVESTNPTKEKKKLSHPSSQSSGSSSDNTGESAEPQSTSPNNEANVSIDIQCDTPASASIDILDHTSKPMAGIASVLHHKAPVEPVQETSTSEDQKQQHQEQEREQQPHQVLSDNFGLLNLATFKSSVDDQQAMTASSLPASPPHINLAVTTNSHSIDSAEAAAIRIQSAFRGYHTRKHSPYRRRSPANTSSPTARPLNLSNGNSTNGQPKRNTLRQQDATILDDDDDEGVEGCERLTGVADRDVGDGHDGEESSNCRLTNTEKEQENEAIRQSRQRHRAEETHTVEDPSGQTSVKNIGSTMSYVDDLSTVKELRSNESKGKQTSHTDDQTVLSSATNKAAALLTSSEPDEHLEPSGRLDEGWTNKLSVGNDGAAEARWSTSLDTDSSNLGAALSLNDDISEDIISQTAQGPDALRRLSQQRESIGAAVEEVEEFVENSSGVAGDEPSLASRELASQQLDELEMATSQLEAALEEATEKEANYYGEELAENLAGKILDGETQQNLNELESDNIERRNPSGLVSDDHAKIPPQASADQQPAVVASNSLEEVQQQPLDRDLGRPRLDVISPDEAIGSGESSPVPLASHKGNSSDDGAESDQDQDGQQQQERGLTDNVSGPSSKADNNQQGNEGRKKNRNKRKGKK